MAAVARNVAEEREEAARRAVEEEAARVASVRQAAMAAAMAAVARNVAEDRAEAAVRAAEEEAAEAARVAAAEQFRIDAAREKLEAARKAAEEEERAEAAARAAAARQAVEEAAMAAISRHVAGEERVAAARKAVAERAEAAEAARRKEVQRAEAVRRAEAEEAMVEAAWKAEEARVAALRAAEEEEARVEADRVAEAARVEAAQRAEEEAAARAAAEEEEAEAARAAAEEAIEETRANAARMAVASVSARAEAVRNAAVAAAMSAVGQPVAEVAEWTEAAPMTVEDAAPMTEAEARVAAARAEAARKAELEARWVVAKARAKRKAAEEETSRKAAEARAAAEAELKAGAGWAAFECYSYAGDPEEGAAVARAARAALGGACVDIRIHAVALAHDEIGGGPPPRMHVQAELVCAGRALCVATTPRSSALKRSEIESRWNHEGISPPADAYAYAGGAAPIEHTCSLCMPRADERAASAETVAAAASRSAAELVALGVAGLVVRLRLVASGRGGLVTVAHTQVPIWRLVSIEEERIWLGMSGGGRAAQSTRAHVLISSPGLALCATPSAPKPARRRRIEPMRREETSRCWEDLLLRHSGRRGYNVVDAAAGVASRHVF